MKVIRYLQSWNEVNPLTGSSEVKFAAGSFYPVTDESNSHVVRGIAEVIDAPEDPEKAAAAADTAEAKAQKAAAQADEARDAANASAAALEIATKPQE